MENLRTSVLWVLTCVVTGIDVCAFDGEFGEHLPSDCVRLLATVFPPPPISWTRCPRSRLLTLVVKIPCLGTSDVCDECRCSCVGTVEKPSTLFYNCFPFILITEFVKELNTHSSFVTLLFSLTTDQCRISFLSSSHTLRTVLLITSQTQNNQPSFH